MEKRLFPIYKVSAKWDQDDYKGNSTSFSFMRREPMTLELLKAHAEDWWTGYMEKHKGHDKVALKELHPILLSLEARHVEDEEWCLTWFSHYTFDDGQDDSFFENSFSRFVSRMKARGGDFVKYTTKAGEERSYWQEKYCLMGAEDHWRWEGPCRCERCKAQGVVSFNH